MTDAIFPAPRTAERRTARAGQETLEIAELAGALWRQARLALSVCGVIAGLAVLYLLLAPQTYSARVEVLLDPRAQSVLDTDLSAPGTGSDAALVESQLRVVTSDSVMRRVVDALKLDADAEFTSAAAGTPEAKAQAVRALQRRVSVSRATQTYLIEIRVSDRNRTRAAEIANETAKAYIADQTETSSAQERRANEILTARLAGLKEDVRLADQNVAAFRAANGLTGTLGTETSQQQIAELNQRLVAAQADAAAKRARAAEAARIEAGGSGAGSLGSQVLAGLKLQLAQQMAKESELSVLQGDRHPQVIEARAQVRTTERLIGDETGRLITSARAELAAAEAAERDLAARLDDAARRAQDLDSRLISLRELEREASAARAVYESVLTRAKQTGEAAAVATPAARILAPASAESAAAAPSRVLILMIALALGVSLGAAAAVFADGRDQRIRHAAALSRATGLDVLASAPSLARADGSEHEGFALAMRDLRDALRDGEARAHERSVTIVSARQNEDAPAVALNLAMAVAAEGERVLLIDADTQRRSLTALAAPSAARGLGEVLAGALRLEEAVTGGKDGSVAFLAATSGGEPMRISRAAMAGLLDAARARYDYVIIAAAPVFAAPDARMIAAATSQILFVADASRTIAPDAEAAVKLLKAAAGKTMGAVLTKTDRASAG